MKQTLFTKQLAEYFNVYLLLNKKCSKNTISSYADGFVALFQFFKEIKDIPHYRINYSDITTKTMDEYLLWLQNEKNYSAASQKQRISAVSSFLKYASGRETASLGAYNAVSQAQTPKIPKTVFPRKRSGFYWAFQQPKVSLEAGMLHYWLCFMILVQEHRRYATS